MTRVGSALGLALLCGHCAVGAILALLGAGGLLAMPTLFGVSWNWVWPPLVILGGFTWWLWSGRRAAACDVPDAPSS